MARVDLDINLVTLVALLGGVDVVEGARQAIVEDGISTQGQTLVITRDRTDLESTGLLVSSLRRTIELELIVGGNVSLTSGGVVENATGQMELDGFATGDRLTLLQDKDQSSPMKEDRVMRRTFSMCTSSQLRFPDTVTFIVWKVNALLPRSGEQDP